MRATCGDGDNIADATRNVCLSAGIIPPCTKFAIGEQHEAMGVPTGYCHGIANKRRDVCLKRKRRLPLQDATISKQRKVRNASSGYRNGVGDGERKIGQLIIACPIRSEGQHLSIRPQGQRL